MDFQSISSLAYFVSFLLLITCLGIPIVFLLFKKNGDHGFAFSKLSVILILSFTSWLIGYMGEVYIFKTILAEFLIIAIISSIVFFKNKKDLIKTLKSSKKIFIFEELIFWIFFFSFILIRVGNPDLWHPVMGGEKPMDFAFLNAMVRTTSLPPFDPWFAGSTINYYYFGQFIGATIIKLLNIPSAIFYNLFLSYLFAQAAVGAASIIFSFTKNKAFSLLGSFFLLVSGNLAQIPVIIGSFKTAIPINGWYWTATRIMPNFEINEFPFFTFLYADLHSHLIALPIDLFLIALLTEFYQLLKSQELMRATFLVILASIVLGILRMTNIWDYPSFLLFTFLVIFLSILHFSKKSVFKRLLIAGFLSAISVVVSNLSILPFIIFYKTGPLGATIYTEHPTRISDYVLIHGFFLFILITFFIVFIKFKNIFTLSKIYRLFLFIPLAICVILLSKSLIFLAFISFLISLTFITFVINRNDKLAPPVILLIFALFLTSIPDIIDIKLGLGRMNTVFKFYFQGWIFFALGSSIASFFIFEKIKKHSTVKIVVMVIFFVLFGGTLLYPVTATPAKINDRMGLDRRPTLNGEHYMNNSIYYDKEESIPLRYDMFAIDWIKKNIEGKPVILEASVPIYRWGSRISIYTGLPTVLGWDWHEIAHRQYLPASDIQIRTAQIQQIYESNDFEATKKLLVLYNISYIYLGQLEKAYYNTSGIRNIIVKHPAFFVEVYKNPQVTIYKFLNGRSY